MQIEHEPPKGGLAGFVGADRTLLSRVYGLHYQGARNRPVFARTADQVSEIGLVGFCDRVVSPHFIEATDLPSRIGK